MSTLRNAYSKMFIHLWLIVQVMILFVTIIRVELTLVLNNIGNVNDLGSTGQLIAFIVSIGGCMATGMHLTTHQRKEKYGAPLYDGCRVDKIWAREQYDGGCSGSVPDVHMAVDLEAQDLGSNPQGQPSALDRRATF